MITIHKGSILEVKADVLVNPANSFLNHAGGLAAIIDNAARARHNGYVYQDWKDAPVAELQSELRPALKEYEAFSPGLVPTGGAVLGPPGALCRRFKAIVHAVGPIWGGGQFCERTLLRSAYSEALSRAEEHAYNSIVFPAISAGVFGAPIRAVAYAAVSMCENTPLDVTFALMDDEHVDMFQTYVDAYSNGYRILS